MRLIDADALLNRMQEDPLFDLVERYGVSGVINAEPTVDAMPVIRCKDCKHWQYESCFVESEEGDADSIILDRFAFDFCSRAERKEE